MATLESGWRRLVSEIGIRFDCERAQQRFRAAGQDVGDEGVVRFDPDFLLEQVAKAPGEFAVRARNPARDIVFGGDHMVFGGVAGAPFVLDGAERRDGTLADLERFVQLGHTFDEIDTTGLIPCEPTDLPLDSRHLDMAYAQLTLTDKVRMSALFDGDKTRDSLAMTAIVLRRRRGARAGAGRVRRLERQLAAALRRRDARGDGGARRAQPGHRRDAVPADGRDGAGRDPGGARAADRGAARGRRLRAAGAARRAGAARLVPVAHRHAVGLARASAGRSRRSDCSPRVSWRAGSGCRGGRAAARSRRASGPMRRRVRGPEHDAAGVPGGRELPAPHRGLAGVRAGRELHEVRARHRGGADPAARSSRRSR